MKKKYLSIITVAFLVLILDQLTKLLVRKNFQSNESFPIIENIFHLTYLTNTGSAFGLFKGINWFFVLLSLFVIGIILYYIREVGEKEKLAQFAFGLILGGTIGNLADRLFLGHVVDFLDFRIWPVFNIADSSISIGVIILIILLWKK